MSNLCLLDFNDSQIRTVIGEDRAVWFVAQDVCKVLDISNVSDACSKLADKHKRDLAASEVIGITDNQKITRLLAISEAGFYKLAFTSRKPEAEAFTDWVCEVVIPSIRATGTYKSPKAIQLENWKAARLRAADISVFFSNASYPIYSLIPQ